MSLESMLGMPFGSTLLVVVLKRTIDHWLSTVSRAVLNVIILLLVVSDRTVLS